MKCMEGIVELLRNELNSSVFLKRAQAVERLILRYLEQGLSEAPYRKLLQDSHLTTDYLQRVLTHLEDGEVVEVEKVTSPGKKPKLLVKF